MNWHDDKEAITIIEVAYAWIRMKIHNYLHPDDKIFLNFTPSNKLPDWMD